MVYAMVIRIISSDGSDNALTNADRRCVMSVFKDFLVKAGLEINDKFKVKPYNHDSAVYISSDGTVKKYHDIDDMHLANIYVLLLKSKAMAKDLIEHGDLNMDNLNAIEDMLPHAAYEIWIRGLFVSNKEMFQIVEK